MQNRVENKGIVGENYQVISEPNSWNAGIDGDLGLLAADAYEEPGKRRDVSGLHGTYDYHKNCRRLKQPFIQRVISYLSRAEARPSTMIGGQP